MAEERKDNREDLDMMDDMEDLQQGSLFWSLKVPATGSADIDAPDIPEYIVHITKACFGANMKKGSRTVVLCNSGEDDEFVPLCVLSSHCENVNLDLLFNETAEFKVEGTKPSEVWLTGFLRPGFDIEESPMPFDDRQMLDMSDDMDQDMEGLGEDDVGEDDVAPQLIEDESSSDVSPSPQKKRKLNNSQAKVTANGKTSNKQQRKSPKQKPVVAAKEEPKHQNNNKNNNNNEKASKKQKNKKAAKQKPVAPATPAAEAPAPPAVAAPAVATSEEAAAEAGKKKKKQKNKKKKMSGGLEYKDTRQGSGTPIKKGDRVSVYYIGQLASNQKIFDKTLNGDGFEFVVGAGEVIKGWDMGIAGMKGAGSKRKLWVPAKLAYGDQAQTGIPSNSELLFTIEVKKVDG